MSSAVAYQIKAAVTMNGVAGAYGLAVDRRGFAHCPFHQEKSSSFKVYDGSRGFHCFGCGATGDVTDFVMRYFSIGFGAALEKLNTDFGLNLPVGRKATDQERRQMAQIALERARKREAITKAINEAETDYWGEFAHWWWLECCVMELRPKSANEALDPMFIYAIQELPQQRDALNRAADRRWLARCRNNVDAPSCQQH